MDLSWNMMKRACHYAEKIQLHQLDSSASPILAGVSKTMLDAGRKGFWELVNMDLYFQLVHDMPPVVITGGGWNNAKVNLPWLTEFGTEKEPDMTTTRFLIDSRRTFVLIEFFQLLENAKTHPDLELMSKAEALCHRIEALHEDWDIVSRSQVTPPGGAENQ